MAEDQKQWFAVHTYSGYEERVRRNLEQRIKFMDTDGDIAQVVVPTEEQIEVRSGQRRTLTRRSALLQSDELTSGLWSLMCCRSMKRSMHFVLHRMPRP